MIKLILITFTFIFLGCALIVVPSSKFIIENKTGKKLTIETYSKHKLINNINIPINGKYDTTYKHNVGDIKAISPFKFEIIDSLIINFDNQKIIRFYCGGEILFNVGLKNPCVIEKDLMKFANSSKSSKTKGVINGSTKTITFDNNDYERAIPF